MFYLSKSLKIVFLIFFSLASLKIVLLRSVAPDLLTKLIFCLSFENPLTGVYEYKELFEQSTDTQSPKEFIKVSSQNFSAIFLLLKLRRDSAFLTTSTVKTVYLEETPCSPQKSDTTGFKEFIALFVSSINCPSWPPRGDELPKV